MEQLRHLSRTAVVLFVHNNSPNVRCQDWNQLIRLLKARRSWRFSHHNEPLIYEQLLYLSGIINKVIEFGFSERFSQSTGTTSAILVLVFTLMGIEVKSRDAPIALKLLCQGSSRCCTIQFEPIFNCGTDVLRLGYFGTQRGSQST